MFKIDVTKIVPLRFFLGVIPGVFFQSSIAIGNPHGAALLLFQVREIYPFGPYALILLFIVSSLFIGSGFYLAAWLVQQLMLFGVALWSYVVRGTFGSQWLYRQFAKWRGNPPKQTIFIRVLSKLIFWARRREFSSSARPVLQCLHLATKALLKKRYGIDATFAHDTQEHANIWGIWYSVLGANVKGFKQEVVSSRIFLSCALAGFTALYASPALRERYFISLCSIFALTASFVSFSVVLWSADPAKRSVLRLKSILAELSESTNVNDRESADPELAATATAGTD